ncbi:MAG: Holliday junction branch migration protein RuvA [Acidobacteria bacterium]|mgnify:CR=1 FL=1|nr:MAG: Holliday junction branch migration protein RuvA [Acidobacteriota bacterium]
MIRSLRGALQRVETDQVVVDVGGVGYAVRTPLSTLYALEQGDGGLEPGREVALLVHTQVRDDAIELFGFASDLELRLFELLVSVSGIGPRLAQGVLSGLAPDEVAGALARGDVPQLVRIPGVGKKTAERMVLELRDKVTRELAGLLPNGGRSQPVQSQAQQSGGGDSVADAVSALLGLGYRANEARSAVDAAWRDAGEGSAELTLQELLRAALRRLAKV